MCALEVARADPAQKKNYANTLKPCVMSYLTKLGIHMLNTRIFEEPVEDWKRSRMSTKPSKRRLRQVEGRDLAAPPGSRASAGAVSMVAGAGTFTNIH